MQIKLTNVTSQDSPVLAHLRWLLHGKTYMNFRVLVCPVGGSFDVVAETDYDSPEAEIRDFLLFVLASNQ